MKNYKLLISIMIALSCSACSNNKKITETIHSLESNQIDHKISYKVGDMLECGRGYVVGIWSNGNKWNQWAVWLSKTGRNWSNKDVQIYWAYSALDTDYDSGKNAYATVLAAQASGQIVALLDDQWPFRCNKWGPDPYNGPQFNSVQAWFP
ncbi:exported protein of unknown function [Xenorhabdus poinarii G6]|uniref:Lipoprotein n=2 Tax=Xenorhabdus poinarii TaxID=40577 RepID=A0A068R2V8_9GAMM|nr:exported protein of unknown function [Xenorhabdus poinarii G6]